MFFEFKIGTDVMMVNLSQITRIKVAPPGSEVVTVTFFFTDGHEETASLTPTVLQRLYTSIPRPTIYGAGGMG
jgi:hypothetical protein